MLGTDSNWKRLADDPYFAVLSDDRFHRDSLTDATIEEFWGTGREHVERLCALVRSTFQRELHPRLAVDFGCGVGRILAPLASISDSAIGLDISPKMIEEARRNCSRNVRFALSDDYLTALTGISYDFVHSFIVFQHIRPDRGELIISRLIEGLASDGIGAIHVTYAPHAGSHLMGIRRTFLGNIAASLLRLRSPFSPYMEMNCYNLNRLFQTLQHAGCRNVHVEFTDHDFMGCLLLFRKP